MKIYPVPERQVRDEKTGKDIVLPRRTVRCPVTDRELVAVFDEKTGQEVGTEVSESDSFWIRRLADGDVSDKPMSVRPVPAVAPTETPTEPAREVAPAASSGKTKGAE